MQGLGRTTKIVVDPAGHLAICGCADNAGIVLGCCCKWHAKANCCEIRSLCL